MVDNQPYYPEPMVRWLGEANGIAIACSDCNPQQQGERIRELRRLLLCAPHPIWLEGLIVPAAARLETFLATHAWESAALSFLGHDAGYLFSRGSDGNHLASIILPGWPTEVTASASTTALAIVGALTAGLEDGAANMLQVCQPDSESPTAAN